MSHHTRFSVLAVLVVSAAAVACSATESESATGATEAADSELRLTPSESSASLKLDAADGACASFASIVEAHVDELKALCPEREIAMPSAVDREGCEVGSVKSVTFSCFKIAAPPAPPNACRPIVVKAPEGALPESASENGEALAPIVCPRVGGVQPPLPRVDGGAPVPPPAPSAAPAPSGAPVPPPAPSGAPAPPGAAQAPAPSGAQLPPPAGASGQGAPKGPPRLICCAPPAGGGGAGGPAPAPSGSAPATPAR